MNATAITYNPFRAAAEAAFSELSSDSAQHYYSIKAQKDFQNTLDATATVFVWVYQLAEMTYMMGIQCRQWCEELEANAQSPAPASATLLLAPAKDAPMVAHIEVGMKLLSDAVRSGLNLITPATEEVEEVELTPGALLILPPLTTGIIGQVWNPEHTDMHRENARMVLPAQVEAELGASLDVPGAKGRTRKPRAKAQPKTSARKRKGVKVEE